VVSEFSGHYSGTREKLSIILAPDGKKEFSSSNGLQVRN
jgi:hypothetical protein